MIGIDAFLDHEATFKRLDKVQADASGAPRKTDYKPVPTLVGVPCRLRPTDAKTLMLYAQRQMRVSHRVYFDRKLAVRRGDRIDFTHGPVMLVVGWFDTDELGELFVVDCEEQYE